LSPDPLLIRLRERDPGACAAFVDAHYGGVYRCLFGLTRDADAAADLTQETFAGFWESLARWDAARPLDLRAWLYGIARNRWRKHRRRAGHEAEAPLEAAGELAGPEPGPAARLVGRVEQEALWDAVAALPPALREVLVLRVFEELSYAQIAEALLVSEGLARWRVCQARRLLVRRLTQSAEEESHAIAR
jgi:RNA polymerase sigma factor (sigma-70 family)